MIRIRNCQLAFVILLFWISVFSGLEGRNLTSATLHRLYRLDKRAELQNLLDTLQTEDPALSDCIRFYRAMLLDNGTDVYESLEQLTQTTSDSDCVHRAFLEMGRIDYLKREYERAEDHLGAAAPLPERHFWLAETALKLNRSWSAIHEARKAIEATDDPLRKAGCQLIIAQAHIQRKEYDEAFQTLDSIPEETDMVLKPFITFQMGFCRERRGDFEAAVRYYRHILKEYSYTQYANPAERRILALRNEPGVEVDLEKLFSARDHSRPDPEMEVVEIQPQPEVQLMRYYLQAGAFSTKERAGSQADNIRQAGFSSIIFPKTIHDQTLYVTAAGPFDTREEAESARTSLKNAGIDSWLIKK